MLEYRGFSMPWEANYVTPETSNHIMMTTREINVHQMIRMSKAENTHTAAVRVWYISWTVNTK